MLAANTAFQDFPRLSSILARDQFMPSQFRNRGDRLVFSNGVLVLAGARALPRLALRRRAHGADPALRDRGLHRVHAVAGGDGPAVVPDEGCRMALARDPERRGRRGDGDRPGRRHDHEVPERRLRGGDRDPDHRHALPAGAQALPPDRPTPADRAADRRRRGVELLRAPRRRLRSGDDRRRLLPVHDPMPAADGALGRSRGGARGRPRDVATRRPALRRARDARRGAGAPGARRAPLPQAAAGGHGLRHGGDPGGGHLRLPPAARATPVRVPAEDLAPVPAGHRGHQRAARSRASRTRPRARARSSGRGAR